MGDEEAKVVKAVEEEEEDGESVAESVVEAKAFAAVRFRPPLLVQGTAADCIIYKLYTKRWGEQMRE